MVQLAANAMSTVETVKTVLSIGEEDSSYDELLILLINYTSAWLERQTGRTFGIKRRTEHHAGSGRQQLVLQHYPIRKIHRISDTASGAACPPSEYSFSEAGDIGVVYRDTGWARRGYPTGLVPDTVLTKRYLQVDYTAGYVLPKDVDDDTPEDWILPADLQGIIWQAAAQELALLDNGADGLSAFGIADVSWTFDKAPRQGWLDIIAAYKKVV